MFNCKNKGFTLTSIAGLFLFDCDTPMSHAKLVRDTVTANVMGVQIGVPRIQRSRDWEHHTAWLRANIEGPVKNTIFEWVPA